ncbi:ABC transporter [Sphingobium sp. AP49]|uniref:Gldg family protein n=1 Tax=Sphingobium sp. AP49 TaxID=1144307 RepID=UPI00026ED171|nr:DUF4350 domain-containing protein [Sphingobium sp. AP49]WHO38077.1 ABC transporter [Sphingobium sp. AP49]
MRWRRPVQLFLALWLPGLIALTVGLVRAWHTGQVDPWDWAIAAGLMLIPAGAALARWGWLAILWVMLGVAGTVLVFCWIAAARAPDPLAAAGLGLIALMAAVAGKLLRARGWKMKGAGLALLGGTALILWRGPAQPILSQPHRPALAVISALPLFWAEGGLRERRDAPIVTVLRTRFELQPLDDPGALVASGAQLALVAQPRALTPQALVALDRWVRGGGRLVLLDDPQLRWPSRYGFGDRRRAPSSGALGLLLAHWNVEARPVVEAEIRHFLPDGRLVTLSGMAPMRDRARLTDGGMALPLRLRIGRGEAIFLGDADLIDDRLWLADPIRPLEPRAWSADTPALLVEWLGGELPGGRRWMRDVGDVRLGLRSALLVGMGWAILGFMLLSRKSGRKVGGTKSENKLAEGLLNG